MKEIREANEEVWEVWKLGRDNINEESQIETNNKDSWGLSPTGECRPHRKVWPVICFSLLQTRSQILVFFQNKPEIFILDVIFQFLNVGNKLN